MHTYSSAESSDNFQSIIDELNFGGRQKACKGQGLTGKEKRACAKQLKASGWKKGQPIPADMSGVTPKDVAQTDKEDSTEKTGSTGMSTTVKLLIGGGVLVVLVGGFLILRARKKATV